MKKMYLLFTLLASFLLFHCTSDDNWDISNPDEKVAYNVKEYGAKGDGQTNDALFIQKTIDACSNNGGGYVIIPAGNYRLEDALVLKNKVHLKFDKKASLQRYCDNYMFVTIPKDTVVKGFEAASDFSIEGGVFDMRGSSQKAYSCMVLVHSENINIKNITILNCLDETHAIDITGSRNIVIENSVFSGKEYSISTTAPYAEAIQIDLAKPGSTSAINGDSFDYTITENVTIRNCVFEKGWARAVGSHSGAMDKWFKNITIENNEMKGLIDYAISTTRAVNWNIKGNIITDCVAGIRLKNSEAKHDTYPETGEVGYNQGCYNVSIEANKLTNIKNKHGIQIYSKDKINGRTEMVVISNNTIDKVLLQYPIDIRNSDNVKITDNTISNFVVKNPIRQSELNTNITVSGNTIL